MPCFWPKEIESPPRYDLHVVTLSLTWGNPSKARPQKSELIYAESGQIPRKIYFKRQTQSSKKHADLIRINPWCPDDGTGKLLLCC